MARIYTRNLLPPKPYIFNLQNNWVGFSPGEGPAAFLFRDWVMFNGRAKAGILANNTVIATLPIRFRPKKQANLAGTGRTTTGATISYRMQVLINGDVVIFGVAAALGVLTLDYISLDGMNFMIV